MLEAIALCKTYKLRSVRKSRGDTEQSPEKRALDGLNLRIEPGEVFCLLGANGAGKTTTINCFLGFIAPSSGRAEVGGLDVAHSPWETKRNLAYIPEQVMLYRHLTGLENLEYLSGLSGVEHSRDALCSFLMEAGLPREAARRPVSGYSKGMRQKVGIAVALAKGARVLLLDEPTSGLDPLASNEFSALLQRLSADGVAILMATHDLFRAKEAGTRVGIMREGRLLLVTNTKDVSHTELERLYLDSVRAEVSGATY